MPPKACQMILKVTCQYGVWQKAFDLEACSHATFLSRHDKLGLSHKQIK